MQLDQVYSGDPMAMLLHWHYRLGHVSFKVLQSMAEQGILDKCLAKCKVPSAQHACSAGPPEDPGEQEPNQMR